MIAGGGGWGVNGGGETGLTLTSSGPWSDTEWLVNGVNEITPAADRPLQVFAICIAG